jgi:hypothetical protein
MSKKEETKVASIIKRAQNHPVLAWVIVACLAFSGIAAVIIKFDNLLKVFHPSVETPGPPSLVSPKPIPELPIDSPKSTPSPVSEKPDLTAPLRRSTLPARQVIPKPILISSLQVKAVRNAANNRVTFSVLLKNNSDEKVRIHTLQSASFIGTCKAR